MNQKTRPGGGRLLVAGILLVAFAGSAFTWWNYSRNNPSTSDAILLLPSAEIPARPPEEPLPPRPQGHLATDRALAEAQAEARILGEAMEAARRAIEEAVVMVQEQKENFDFANDRYEKLMPLVETGALEPLAASQIQSAYISARAGFAQAKFFLAQARRDFGSEESRRWRVALARQRVETLAVQLAAEKADEDKAASMDATKEPGSESLAPSPGIEAYFRLPPMHPIVEGMRAKVTTPAAPGKKLSARVETIEHVDAPSGPETWRVFLRLLEPPPPEIEARTAVACQVTIDTTLPVPVSMPAVPGQPEPKEP